MSFLSYHLRSCRTATERIDLWADIQKRIPFITWTVKTVALLIAQIHGYLLGLKSTETLIVGL